MVMGRIVGSIMSLKISVLCCWKCLFVLCPGTASASRCWLLLCSPRRVAVLDLWDCPGWLLLPLLHYWACPAAAFQLANATSWSFSWAVILPFGGSGRGAALAIACAAGQFTFPGAWCHSWCRPLCASCGAAVPRPGRLWWRWGFV